MANSKSTAINESMLDLFNIEAATHSQSFIKTLADLEPGDIDKNSLTSLSKYIRSIKGAAQLVNVENALNISRLLESILDNIQGNKSTLTKELKSILLNAVNTIGTISGFNLSQHINPSSDFTIQLNNTVKDLSLFIRKGSGIISEHENTTSTNQFQIPEQIDLNMAELFSIELSSNLDIISNNLLMLEDNPDNINVHEQLMRASHSIKGAAKLVQIDPAVKLSHAMEDFFVQSKETTEYITEANTNLIFQAIDLLKSIVLTDIDTYKHWASNHTETITSLINNIKNAIPGNNETISNNDKKETIYKQKTSINTESNDDTIVRVSSKRINKLMGLAGELTVTSNWVKNHSSSMLNLKKKHNDLLDYIERLRFTLSSKKLNDLEIDLLTHVQRTAEDYRETLASHIFSLDEFERRSTSLSSRLTHEIISSRMRPFKDITPGYKRMIRDTSKSLGKKARLEIHGEDTQVDREILEKIEPCINHMLRNAIDHGIEIPETRLNYGKDAYGTISLTASHNAGQLLISISDDGKGVDTEQLRQTILKKKLVNKEMADALSTSELLDFLLLPSFTTRDIVTEISGRGVGLNVVHNTLQELRGKLHSTTSLYQGMTLKMELPLTLSVVRCLIISSNNEQYAFPLASIHNTLKINRTEISSLEDKQYISHDGNHIGLIHISQILGFNQQNELSDIISVIIIGDWNQLYGIVVDKIHGECGLALRPLNKRLGKVKDINSAALADDGEPILVFDVDDLIQSTSDIIAGKGIIKINKSGSAHAAIKKILVVDDSLTVREVEKKLLESHGYHVDIAVDGVDAWNTIRTGNYDLIVSDVDMPRMNGIELIKLIKNDHALRSIPVMMVSYKDREEDRQKGLQAGADYYLTKGSFHDETLVEAVIDLIGEAQQ